jgi:hypothetical protein
MKNPDGTTKKGAAKNADTNTSGKLSKIILNLISK